MLIGQLGSVQNWCKYVAVPNPITTKPIPKQTTLLYKVSGVIKLCNKESH